MAARCGENVVPNEKSAKSGHPDVGRYDDNAVEALFIEAHNAAANSPISANVDACINTHGKYWISI
jgi:hypothetical protein